MARKKIRPGELDAFVQAGRQRKLQAARAKAPGEVDLWNTWNKGGRKTKDLTPLMASLENVVRSQSRQYGTGYGGALVQGATELELRRHLKKAIESYNPNKGVKLSTWAVNQMRAFTGTAAKRRNFGTQSKKDFQSTQTFNNVVNEIKAQGQEPTPQLIAQRAGWPISKVRRMQVGTMRRELYTGITPGQDDDVGGAPSQMRSIMSLMYFNNQEERKVFQALKLHAKDEALDSPLNIKRLAKKMGIPESRLYKIRDTLKKRVKPLIDRI